MVTIGINLTACYEHRLTPNMYVILNLLNRKRNRDLKTYSTKLESFQYEVMMLGKAKFLTFADIKDTLTYELTTLGISIFKPQILTDKWLEFKAIYPTKDGLRRLHDKPASNEKEYINYLLEGVEHEIIMRGTRNLAQAYEEAEQTGQFFPVKNMSTYLNNQSWEEYLDWVSDIKEERTASL